MRYFIIVLLFFVLPANGQNGKKITKNISLVEEYTIDGYKTPKSILFSSGGDWEIGKYYKILYKKIKKEYQKNIKGLSSDLVQKADIPVRISSFNELDFKFQDIKQKAVCVFALGDMETNYDRITKKTGKTVFVNKDKILYYDLYLILIEPETNKVLMKRKYSIKARSMYYSQHKQLAKEIVKEIKG